jgi:pSer/pThr/pTyr-binding forkhead associated (FHA) protein
MKRIGDFNAGARGTAVVVLRHAERELMLMPGKYLIGRSRSCQLIVSSELVSRRHAELHVDMQGRATLRDLGSHNGVSVNGKRMTSGSVALASGDQFKIGTETFTVYISEDALDSASMRVVEVVTESAPTEVKHTAVASMAETRATHDLDLVCSAADRAIDFGAISEAERLLTIHLNEVLTDIRTLQRTSTTIRNKAYDYALRLAEVTKKQQWFDYAVDVMLAQGVVATQEQVESLLHAQKKIGRLETQRVELYSRLVRRKPPTTENLRVASLLEAIVAAGQSHD